MRTLATIALALAACGGHHTGGDGDGGVTFATIEVDPPQATLSVPLGGTAMQSYTITGIAADGTRNDITSQCVLQLDAAFGTSMAQTITVGPHGGKTQVTAVCSSQAGTAQLIVNLSGSVVVDPAP